MDNGWMVSIHNGDIGVDVIDSTIGERNEAKKQQRYIYRTIKKIDPSLGDLLLRLF